MRYHTIQVEYSGCAVCRGGKPCLCVQQRLKDVLKPGDRQGVEFSLLEGAVHTRACGVVDRKRERETNVAMAVCTNETPMAQPGCARLANSLQTNNCIAAVATNACLAAR